MFGEHPFGSIPFSGLLDAQVTQTVQTTARFASHSLVTRPTDAPANEYIPGRLARGISLARRLTMAEGGQWGPLIETDRGEIVLANDDGALDELVNNYAADGRQVRLYIGATEIDSFGREKPKAFSTFERVYTSVAGPWRFEHEREVRLRIESLSNRLQNRLQQQVYAGTGGAEGSADIAGRTKPIAFGRCLNIPAQLVDPAILTYQLHSGRIDSITDGYDAGISVPFDQDHPSYAAMAAAAVPPGTYASSLAVGFVRLGSIPTGQVTADIRGDNAPDGFLTYSDQHGPVIRKIMVNYANFAADEIDTVSFDVYDALQPESMGLFLPAGDQSTVEEVITRIAFSGGAFIGQDRSGLYRIQRLDGPDSDGLVHWAFTDRDIISIERENLPYGIPWRSWGVGYQRNWTVQTDADLAIGVSQSRRQFLSQPSRYAYVSSSAIALRHASSSGAPLRDTLFLDQATALAEAQRLIDLYDLNRSVYRIVVKTVLFSAEIGQTVHITYDRWDLHGGKRFIIIDIEDDADRRETMLRVFG